MFPKALEPDEPQFYLGTILLFPFLSCALVLETTWVWLPVGHLQRPPHSAHTLGLWAKQDSVLLRAAILASAPGFSGQGVGSWTRDYLLVMCGPSAGHRGSQGCTLGAACPVGSLAQTLIIALPWVGTI